MPIKDTPVDLGAVKAPPSGYRRDLPGHTGALDPEGELVGTSRWPDFQAELRRFHPDLRLGFDRRNGHYVICRRDFELRYLPLPDDTEGDCVSYQRPFWTIVANLLWALPDPETGLPHFFMRDPGPWLMRELYLWRRRGEHSRFTHDATPWANKAIPATGKRMREDFEAKVKDHARQVVSDFANDLDPSEPWRTKTMGGWTPGGDKHSHGKAPTEPWKVDPMDPKKENK